MPAAAGLALDAAVPLAIDLLLLAWRVESTDGPR